MTTLSLVMANPMLLWFVGYSNLTSIVIVTLCFLAMTIFIGFISMNGDYQSRSNIRIGIEQKNMVKMSNPFFLQLEQQSKKLTDGLRLHLSSLLPSKIFVMWGAKINPFHNLILKPGRLIHRAFVLNRVEDYEELDILHCDKMQFSEAGDHFISLDCPDCVSSAALGDMPRQRYPVAVFIFVQDSPSPVVNATSQDEDGSASPESESESENINSIFGLISIIHLQDDKVTQNSHIISQYVKTSGVPLYSLQPLYLSSDSCQSQQNHQNMANDTSQKHSKSNESSSKTPPAKLKECNNVDPVFSGRTSSSELSLSDDIQGSCPPCGCAVTATSESAGKLHDSQTTEFKGSMTNACDRCHMNKNMMTDKGYDIRPLQEQTGTEGKIISDSACDATNVDSYNDEPDCQLSSQAECVVCQTHPVRCVLLPCRHACVCLGCFELLYRCPMCRAGIESYFLLRSNLNVIDGATDEEEDEQNESAADNVLQDLQHQAVNARFHQMWQRFNARLNYILGFR